MKKKKKKQKGIPMLYGYSSPPGSQARAGLYPLHIPVVGPMCGCCGWQGIVGDEGQCVAVGGGEFDFLAHPHT